MKTAWRSLPVRPFASLALACLGAAFIFLAATSSTAATPPRKPNDGLPRKWIGVTESKSVIGGDTLATHADVTFTLVETYAGNVRRTGQTVYYYTIEKGSKLHVQHSGTSGCTYNTDVVVPLGRGQGLLSILVTRRAGKPVKVEYQIGSDDPGIVLKVPKLTTFPDTMSCPEAGTTTSESSITWLSSGPLRATRLAAKILRGTFQGNEVRTDEWCLVRNRPDLLKCDLGIGPDS